MTGRMHANLGLHVSLSQSVAQLGLPSLLVLAFLPEPRHLQQLGRRDACVESTGWWGCLAVALLITLTVQCSAGCMSLLFANNSDQRQLAFLCPSIVYQAFHLGMLLHRAAERASLAVVLLSATPCYHPGPMFCHPGLSRTIRHNPGRQRFGRPPPRFKLW